jgi:secreted Zn-dependent insulinase-like peptidase
MLTWILPEDNEIWEENPLGYISSLVGDEGPGSILALLKAKGWAETLSSSRTRGLCFAEFQVSVSLTEEGLGHTGEITHIILSYLSMLKNSKDADLKRVYEEMSQIDQNMFRFKSKEGAFGYVSSLVKSLFDYPAKDVLRAPYYQLKFEPSLWKKYASMMTLDNCVIQVVAKAVKSGTFTHNFFLIFHISQTFF